MVAGIWIFAYRERILYQLAPATTGVRRVLVADELAWSAVHRADRPSSTFVGFLQRAVAQHGFAVRVVRGLDLDRAQSAGTVAIQGTVESPAPRLVVQVVVPAGPSVAHCGLRKDCVMPERTFWTPDMPEGRIEVTASQDASSVFAVVAEHAVGIALLGVGDRKEAGKALLRSSRAVSALIKQELGLKPVLRDAAFFLHALGDGANATRALESASALDPGDPKTVVMLAYNHLIHGRIAAALRALESRHLTTPAAHALRGEIAWQIRQPDEAVRHFDEAARTCENDGCEPSFMLNLYRASLLTRAELAYRGAIRAQTALRQLRTSIKQAQSSPDPVELRALQRTARENETRLLAVNETHATAMQHQLEKALALEDDFLFHSLREFALALRNNPTSINAYDKARSLSRSPQDEQRAAIWHARSLSALGHYTEAQEAIDASVRSGRSLPALKCLAEQLMLVGDCQRALAAIEQVIALDPQSGEMSRYKASCILKDISTPEQFKSTMGEAQKLLEVAVREDPGEPQDHEMLAAVYRAQGDATAAANSLERSRKLECDRGRDASCEMVEINALLSHKDIRGARARVKAYYIGNPGDPEFLIDAGLALYRHGDLRGAETIYRVAAQNPRPEIRSAAMCNWGFVFLDRGDWAAAVRTFRRGVEGGIQSADCLAGLGVAYFALGWRSEGQSRYRSALALDPNYRNVDVMRTLNVWSAPAIKLAQRVLVDL